MSRLSLVGLRLSSLPREIGLLTPYVLIKLSDNLFTQFPFSIFEMTWLQKLNLKGNRVMHIPKEISKLVNLNEIWLEENQIEEFPSTLLFTSRLERLWLDFNKIKEVRDCRLVNIKRFSICSGSHPRWRIYCRRFIKFKNRRR